MCVVRGTLGFMTAADWHVALSFQGALHGHVYGGGCQSSCVGVQGGGNHVVLAARVGLLSLSIVICGGTAPPHPPLSHSEVVVATACGLALNILAQTDGVAWCPHPPLGYLWGVARWLAHLLYARLACLVRYYLPPGVWGLFGFSGLLLIVLPVW